MTIPHRLSLIVTTYNRPDALGAVLRGLAAQSAQGFEVIVADDGSTGETAALIEKLAGRMNYPLRHAWQPDQGFRAAAARNRALAVAGRDYIVFLDGDCIPPRDFVRHHCRLAEAGWFVAGNRILCNPDFSKEILRRELPVENWPAWRWFPYYLRREINRLLPLLSLPGNAWRKRRAYAWEGAKTCNLAAWRADLVAVNGFDETYQGWGHEDADLAVRLIRQGILRKDGRFAATVFHLWHSEQDRGREADNQRRLQAVLAGDHIRARQGLEQYLR
jgi:glycosyltransferase involved in cell wall biosynthesis